MPLRGLTERRTRLALLGLAAAAAVTLSAAIVWRVALRDKTEPASVAAAVRAFRDQAAESGGRIPSGVYVYATTGFEYVSALGGRHHRYPSSSPITITRVPCGVKLRWDVLRTRSDTLTVCSEGHALRLERWLEEHEFFGRTDRTDWQCNATFWLPAHPSPGSVSRWHCRGSGSRQDGTMTVVGADTVLVRSSRVPAVHLRTDAREVGDSRGTLVADNWLEADTGLPLRTVYRVRTENASPIGDVTFEERYERRLLSLEPRR